MILDSKIPGGPIAEKWDTRKFENKLVNPANRRRFHVIVVGSGLAGASAAAWRAASMIVWLKRGSPGSGCSGA